MNATRRLDILAIIGCVLAVAALAGAAVLLPRVNASIDSFSSGTGDLDFANKLPESDVRADLRAIAVVKPCNACIAELQKALIGYPSSARLHFRLGTFAYGDQAAQELSRAARLDPDNALPVLLLASKASSMKQWDQARAYLEQANRKPRIDWYGIPPGVSDRHPLGELALTDTESRMTEPVYDSLRHLSKNLSAHAVTLHESRQTKLALRDLSEVRRMGQKLINKPNRSIFELLVGQSIVSSSNGSARPIYASIHDKAALRALDQETASFRYRRAGFRKFVTEDLGTMMPNMIAFLFLPMLVAVFVIAVAALTLLTAAELLILVRKSRGIPATELHQATAMTISPSPARYGLMLLALCAGCAGLTFTLFHENLALLSGLLFAATCGLALWVMPSTNKYWKTYKQACESAGQRSPFRWRDIPVQDKREIVRSQLGLHGGAVIVILLWAGLVSGYAKKTIDAYPWQTGKAFSGFRQQETKYVADLVAGRVKVDEKYIREVEKQDAARKK